MCVCVLTIHVHLGHHLHPPSFTIVHHLHPPSFPIYCFSQIFDCLISVRV
uniref:Uncharacterized protein n=1 Tax=Rhizophora mucronata TaxID=61149 RepID=A0A2P2NNC7_RHIMU